MKRFELAKACRENEEDVWDKQFVWTAVAEAQHRAVDYAGGVDCKIQGRSKAQIQQLVQEVTGCQKFFVQHGTLLLTGGGHVSRAQKIGIPEHHDT